MEIKRKKITYQKKIIYILLIVIFSAVESFIVLSYPQFGNSIGGYQFKYVQWDKEKSQYCYVYKNVRYRRVRIWSDKRRNSDFYRVIMPDNEELFVSQSDRRILLPDRAGITDFDHYKSVLKKDNYNILKRIIENKYNNPFPQNILFIIFITILNAGFSAMVIFPERIKNYQKLFSESKTDKKERDIHTRFYRIVGLIVMFMILYASIRT